MRNFVDYIITFFTCAAGISLLMCSLLYVVLWALLPIAFFSAIIYLVWAMAEWLLK